MMSISDNSLVKFFEKEKMKENGNIKISKVVQNYADAPRDLWPPQTRFLCDNLFLIFVFLFVNVLFLWQKTFCFSTFQNLNFFTFMLRLKGKSRISALDFLSAQDKYTYFYWHTECKYFDQSQWVNQLLNMSGHAKKLLLLTKPLCIGVTGSSSSSQ